MKRWHLRGVFGIGAMLLAGCGGGSDDERVRFEFRMRGLPLAESFVVESRSPAFIEAARAQLRRPVDERMRFPHGPVARGDGGVNTAWGWHLVEPDLVEVTIELCDARPSYLQANLEEWLRSVRTFCPWSAYVHAERP